MQNQYTIFNPGSAIEPALEVQYAVPLVDSALRCSFCGMGDGEVERLFEGRAGYICDECVEVCIQLLRDYEELGVKTPTLKRPWYKKLLGDEQITAETCSFNYHDRHNPQGERLFPGIEAQICERCVRACEMLKSDSLFAT
jgi:ATP-dependent protease Clp ATPase subunit